MLYTLSCLELSVCARHQNRLQWLCAQDRKEGLPGAAMYCLDWVRPPCPQQCTRLEMFKDLISPEWTLTLKTEWAEHIHIHILLPGVRLWPITFQNRPVVEVKPPACPVDGTKWPAVQAWTQDASIAFSKMLDASLDFCHGASRSSALVFYLIDLFVHVGMICFNYVGYRTPILLSEVSIKVEIVWTS